MNKLIGELYNYAKKTLGFQRDAKIKLLDDTKNANDTLGKTAAYHPGTFTISLYTTGRHPKDILRSLAHELVHHSQNLKGEFDGNDMMEDGYAQKNEKLRNAEKEAFLQGNMIFRDWEDKKKMTKELKEGVVGNMRQTIQKKINSGGENDRLLSHFGIYKGEKPGEIKIKALTMGAIPAIVETLKEMGFEVGEDAMRTGIFRVMAKKPTQAVPSAPAPTMQQEQQERPGFKFREDELKLMQGWYSGQNDPLYAITSSAEYYKGPDDTMGWDYINYEINSDIASSAAFNLSKDLSRMDEEEKGVADELIARLENYQDGKNVPEEPMQQEAKYEDCGSLQEVFGSRNERLMDLLFEKFDKLKPPGPKAPFAPGFGHGGPAADQPRGIRPGSGIGTLNEPGGGRTGSVYNPHTDWPENISNKLKLARIKEDELPGGKGDDRPDSDFDPQELAAGTKHEKEHTNDIEKAKEICKDHLSENPAYYSDLRRSGIKE
jgi:hypothetical protein